MVALVAIFRLRQLPSMFAYVLNVPQQRRVVGVRRVDLPNFPTVHL